MHNDRTRGPFKQGKAFWVIPGLSRKAREHPDVSKVSALVIDSVRSLRAVDPEMGFSRADYRVLNIASYLLSPLLEVGTAYRYTDISYGSDASLSLHCIKNQTRVMDFLVLRCQVYEIYKQDVVLSSSSARCKFLQKIFHIAFVVLSPNDVERGLPDPTYSFVPARCESVGLAEIILFNQAA